MVADLGRYLTGWRGYFRFCQTPSVFQNLDSWIRRRLRYFQWKQWKSGRTRFAELGKRGVGKDLAAQTAGSSRGLRHVSRSPALRIAATFWRPKAKATACKTPNDADANRPDSKLSYRDDNYKENPNQLDLYFSAAPRSTFQIPLTSPRSATNAAFDRYSLDQHEECFCIMAGVLCPSSLEFRIII